MKFKQIIGFILLISFIGFMAYKFSYAIAGQQDALPITLLAFVVLAILLLAIRKILTQ